jgi:hypothetical protein
MVDWKSSDLDKVCNSLISEQSISISVDVNISTSLMLTLMIHVLKTEQTDLFDVFVAGDGCSMSRYGKNARLWAKYCKDMKRTV